MRFTPAARYLRAAPGYLETAAIVRLWLRADIQRGGTPIFDVKIWREAL